MTVTWRRAVSLALPLLLWIAACTHEAPSSLQPGKRLRVEIPTGTLIHATYEVPFDTVWVYVRHSDGSAGVRLPITWSRGNGNPIPGVWTVDSIGIRRVSFDSKPLTTRTDSLGRAFIAGTVYAAPPDTSLVHLDVPQAGEDSSVSVDIRLVPGWKPGLTAYAYSGGSDCDSRGRQIYAGTVDSLDAVVAIGDSQGLPVVGVTPTWSGPPDGHLVAKPSDANGLAFARWYVGTSSGSFGLRAQLDTSVVVFDVWVRNGPLAQLSISPDTALASTNSTVTNPFAVVATDAFGNIVPRVKSNYFNCFQGNVWWWESLDPTVASIAHDPDGFPDYDWINTYPPGIARFIVVSNHSAVTDTVAVVVTP